MIRTTDHGLYCDAGDFHIDPWRGVERAVVTHAHSDHARPGSRHYLCATPGVGVLRARLGGAASIQGLAYGESIFMKDVRVSLHPAGHVLGSAQVRIERGGEVWVVSGDYKTDPDPTCAAFEPVRCHTFITESTFGLPVFHWPKVAEEMAEVANWWGRNQRAGMTSVIFAYSLGKAQRLLASLPSAQGPLLAHSTVARLLPAYAEAGVVLPQVDSATPERVASARGSALVISPPGTADSAWMRDWGEVAPAFASGWMMLRGTRRRRHVEQGFVISDHADWEGLLSAIRATQASRVWVTHGYTSAMVRWLREQGWEAEVLGTPFRGDVEEESAELNKDG